MLARAGGLKKAKKIRRRFFYFGATRGVVFSKTGVVGSNSAPNERFGYLSLLLLRRGRRTRGSMAMARSAGLPALASRLQIGDCLDTMEVPNTTASCGSVAQ